MVEDDADDDGQLKDNSQSPNKAESYSMKASVKKRQANKLAKQMQAIRMT